MNPEFFGDPEEWERARWGRQDGKRVEIMAPFPHRGEYVFVQYIMTPAGEAMPLTDDVADYVAMLVRTRHRMPHNGYTSQRLIAERLEAIRREREEKRRETDAMLAEIGDRHRTRQEETNALGTRAYSLPRIELARSIPRDLIRNFSRGAKR